MTVLKVGQILFSLALIAFAVLQNLLLYLVFTLLEYQGGFEEFFGLVLFQPLMGLVVSTITALICLISGLPIRLIPRVKNWWREKFFISVSFWLAGYAFVVFGLVSKLILGDWVLVAVILGWFLIPFGTIHLTIPTFLKNVFKEVLQKRNLQ